ncbi:MAG TPA: tRNA (adenosine(37)-N6)-threonylcarbamoyltransferase complex transferase subunit TsaD [Phycisphaerae bacterium]|nr:tRNA (adenosine(37)-N6)-threonylcarbamoyltransferase complex transferase subunit TsaD [Phycisphaerae bacterium]
MATVLGIETSCDETAVGIVDHGHRVRCNLIATQFELHARYGGVVPELASRAHIERLDLLVHEALEQSGCSPEAIDAIAVTRAPGLIGSLLIGVTGAKALAWAWGKPLVGVNHIHAHATSAAIDLDHDPWPAIALVASGGHTSLYHVRDYDEISLLGSTIDDAAGEAFDKVAAILNLGYPGGPIVDRRAAGGNPEAFRFPRTMLKPPSLDFSFSGLKTAVLYQIHGPGKTTGGLEKLTPAQVDDICASFSAAVVDVLVEKTMLAVAGTGADTVVVGGGVAANSRLRTQLAERCRREGLRLHLTPLAYCTDNGAMVAALGGHLLARGHLARLDLTAAASADRS